MAVEVEGTSQLEEFVGIIKRRAWWIIVPTVLLGTLGIAFAVIVPKKYVTMAQVLVRDAPGLERQNTGQAMSRSEGQMAPHLIRSDERIKSVLLGLGWKDYLALPSNEQREYRQELVDSLMIDLQAVPNNAGAQIVLMKFSHTEPQRAYDFLRELSTAWTSDVQARYKESLQIKRDKLIDTAEKLEAELAGYQNRITLLRRANNLAPGPVVDERGRATYTSVSPDRQNQLDLGIAANKVAISELELDITDLKKKHDALKEKVEVVAGGVGDTSTEALVRDYEIQRAELELGLSNLLPNHTDHIRKKRQIDEINQRLNTLRGFDAGGRPLVQDMKPNPERRVLMAAIEEKRILLERLQAAVVRDEQSKAVLMQNNDRLIEAVGQISNLEISSNAASEALQSNRVDGIALEGDVAHTETDAGQFFEDIRRPELPEEPTTPNPYVIAILSILAGLALGLAAAVLTEFSRSTFRSARDMSRVMVLPVLGTINGIVTRRERSRQFFARVTLAIGTASFVCVVSYVTWAWVNDREALSTPVRRVIEGIRQPFL